MDPAADVPDRGRGIGKRSRPPSLAARVVLLASREPLFPPQAKCLVMVSGGQDSTALLEVLASQRLLGRWRPASLHVLHVNHHLRGAESDADESLVRGQCERLGLSLTVAHRPVEKSAGNVQARARDARREAGLATAAAEGCTRIALGHTLDDQVESMLYRLGRYGGLAALRGMLPCDPPWVRPLLGARREETALFCREHGLAFARDQGNVYPGYARTGIRERVLPAFEQVLPGAARSAARTAEVAAEVEVLVAEVVAASGLDVTAPVLDVPRLEALSPAARRVVLHAWLEEQQGTGVSRGSVLAAEALLRVPGSAGRDQEGGWRVHREYDRLWVSRRAAGEVAQPPPTGAEDAPGAAPTPGEIRVRTQAPAPVELRVPGQATWGDLLVSAELVEHFFAPDPSREAYVDAAAVAPPLVVRGPRPGDRVRPLGSPGTRKLQDVLVDLRVPAGLRPSVPLVVSGAKVLWVGGLLVAEEGRITAGTKRIVRLTLSGAGRRDQEHAEPPGGPGDG